MESSKFVVAVMLSLAAIVGLHTVVAATLPLEQPLSSSMVVEGRIAKRFAANNNVRQSCYSEISNDTIPMAKIEASGNLWKNIESGSDSMGYTTNWKCDRMGFVEGGMNFTQEDQRLYFPKCGIYYISSQVHFKYLTYKNNPESYTSLSAQHGVDITPNCKPLDSDQQKRFAHSSLVQNSNSRTSTATSDVVKMCAGGSIRVFVPASSLCCAYGDGHRTHFSAYLLNETDC